MGGEKAIADRKTQDLLTSGDRDNQGDALAA